MSFKDPITVLPLGALIQDIPIKTASGEVQNVVLSLPSSTAYKEHNRPFFGETIGRVANRISGGVIQDLNGRDWQLAKNNGPNCLHGGVQGWGKHIWEAIRSSADDRCWRKEYRYQSKHLDEGYPGAVHATVAYEVRSDDLQKALSGEAVTNLIIDIEYEVRMSGESDAQDNVNETVVSLTNHSYFNISGSSTINGTEATMATTAHLELDDSQIPTGKILPTFQGLQTNVPAKWTLDSPKLDHFFVLNQNPGTVPLDTRLLPMQECIKLHHPNTGIHLIVESTEPGVQIYTGDGIKVPAVEAQGAAKATPERGPRAGIAIEPGRYTNATNHEGWRSMVLLKRGETWGARIRYRLWAD